MNAADMYALTVVYGSFPTSNHNAVLVYTGA